ncbi:MAG TPA: hypothetical protein VGG74_29565 [Kofleriaceae bacterium]|jgi:hypothetical protein
MGLALLSGLVLVACTSNNNGDDDNGSDSVTPTANGVFPANGFIGRTVRVEVTGDATSWTSAATLSFGTGITVSSVTAASPTDLFADIAIGDGATPGMQDVTVMQGSDTYTLSKAFEVDAPASALMAGTAAQGSIVEVQITDVDVANPFDTTTSTDDDGNTIYPNLALSTPAGVSYLIESVQPFSLVAFLLIDVDAGAGGSIAVESGPQGGNVVETPVGALTIMPRTATAITAGTPTTATYGTALGSTLYSFTPGTAPDVTDLEMTATDLNAQPDVFALPASGHFADWDGFIHSTFGTINTTQGALEYYIYWDETGESSYMYTLAQADVALTTTTAIPDTDVSDATAVTITPPALGTGGDVGNSPSGEQWVKFTVTAGDVGKSIHLVNTGGAAVIFTVYTSLANAGTDTEFDSGEQDYTTTAITTAGTYYVSLAADFFSSTGTDYTLAVYIE